MDILNETEQLEVMKFNENPVMKEAVRKVLLAGIYENGVLVPGQPHDPSKNFALSQVFQALVGNLPVSDVELGQNIRAQASGIRLLEMGFKQLESYKQKKSTPKGVDNPAI